MFNKTFITILVALMTVSAMAGKKPNVLFIVVDDLNDYISLLENHPGIKTPNLDKFSKSAMTFTRGYCAGPSCNPSRTSFLSGIAPYHSGVYENGDNMTKSEVVMDSVLLPEQFKKNGYHTMWNGKLFHSKPSKDRFGAMWDDDEGGKGAQGPRLKTANIPPSVSRFNYGAWEGKDTDFSDYSHMLINEKRLAKKYDKPFFMVYGILKPHVPWTAPKRFFDMHPLDTLVMPEVPEGDLDDVPAIAKEYAHYPFSLAEVKRVKQWELMVQSYLACISFMDECLGRVLDALEKGPNAQNTIVCLVADHGFHMGEKEHFTKFALWEKTTRVMYMWRVPEMTEPGSVCERTVNLLDLYPTFNELCGLSEVPQQLDGESIVPLLKNPKTEWNRPAITTYKQNDHAVRNERWRYIRYHDGSEELYDHSKDPNEWTNLAEKPEFKTVKEELGRWLPKKNVPPNTGKGKGKKK